MNTRSTRRNAFRILTSSAASLVLLASTAQAQLTLSGTSYTQNFDGIGLGLPGGWSVRTGATASALGTAATFSGTAVTWADTAGTFKNLASATGFVGSESTAIQAAASDRALGIRQSGSFGDPGASFNFQIANTLGFSNFALTLDLEMLSVQGRSTNWSIQYGIGATPASYTTLLTYTDPGVFGTTTTATLNLGADVNNLSDNVWIRVVALSASSGGGSRDSFGLDNFALSWASSSPTLYWDTNGATAGIGGLGVWDTTTANWNPAATGDGTPTTFASANPVVFGGIGNTVTIAGGGVTASAGVKFESPDYTIDGGALTLSGANTINTDHAAGTFSAIVAPIAGSVGIAKSGAGTLIVAGTNTFTGNVSINGGALQIESDANLGDAANDVVFGGGRLIATTTVNLAATRDVSGGASIEVPENEVLTVNGNTNTTSLTLTGPGAVALEGGTRSVGEIVFTDGGTLSSTAGAITATNISYTQPTGPATITADLNLGATTRTVTVLDGAENVDLTLAGAVAISGGSPNRLHKLGTGTLSLEGANTGLTGSIRLGTAGAIPAAGGTVVISNKDSLGGSAAVQVQFNDGALRSTATLTGPDAIAQGLSIGAGQINPAVFEGGDMEFLGTTQLFRAASSTYTHRIALANTLTLTGPFNASGGSGTSTGLTLEGNGTLVIANASNSHEIPITVDGPTLAVNGELTASTATINLLAGTLTGSGPIAGNVTLGDGAYLAPGNGEGALTLGGNLDLSAGVDLINSQALLFTLGSTSDTVTLTAGGLTIGNGSLEFDDFAFAPGSGFGPGIYPLFASTSAITGTLGSNLEGSIGEFTATLSLADGSSDVVLTVVPEPGSATLLLGGLALLAARRRRSNA